MADTRVLLLEDMATDAELVICELRRGGLSVLVRRVETEADFIRELESFQPQVVLADYKLPTYDGLSALAATRGRDPDLPFIFVTGAMGEEFAIETLIRGATDYVLKDRLAKLVPAVERALAEAESRANRRRVEEQLRATSRELADRSELLRTILDNIPAMITYYTADGRILMVNQTFERVTGWSGEEMKGVDPMAALFPDAEYRRSVREFMKAAKGWRDLGVTTRSGETLDSAWTNVPLSDGTQLGIGIDIRARKHHEQQLIALNAELQRALEELKATQQQVLQTEKLAALGTMAAGIVHELNNPLMGVMNYVDYVSRRTTDPQLQPKLEGARRELERIRKLVKNMLVFARPVESAMGAVAIPALVGRVLELLQADFRVRGIQVALQFQEPLPPAQAKEAPLEQVLMNLLLNARDAVQEQREKRITVGAFARDGEVCITVADNGPGIPGEIRDRIFEPFLTTKPVGVGTGMGLPVSRNIVSDLGGTLTFETREGEGTTFSLVLPVAASS